MNFNLYRTDPKFSLSEIVFTTFVAIWSGARSSYEISKFTKDNLPIFKEFLPFNNGVPSHDTYNRFFSILPEEDFERAFIAFTQYLIGDSFDAKLIKFDKKTQSWCHQNKRGNH